jgi:catechol-2,3-dioxygenase
MRILELHLLADNLKAVTDFYGDLLGFDLLHRDEHLVTVSAGETLLHFRPSHGAPAVYHFAFEVPNNRFDDAYQWFLDHVKLIPITVDSYIADFANWKAKSFYFYDTQGNILECIARFHADTASREKFSSHSINYISEIGIVVDHVAQTIEHVQDDFNIHVFVRQPPLADFAALGDDQGLFIVAANDRPWYPTNIRSCKCPIGIVFEQHGHQFHWKLNQ